jgi:glycosyltransferase involved in cell wall biosynthesis
MVVDGWTLKKYKYKNIPIYRFITSDRINEDITNGISLVHSFWYKQSPNYRNIYNKETHIILANSLEEKEYYENNTEFNVVFGNHNAFIDESQYNIQDSTKLYNMVINSTFSDYKRTHLAANIPNVVHIGYSQNLNMYIPEYGHLANFSNNSRNMSDYKYLNYKEIVSLYNSSHIGGIFSHTEGACYSSSEYLLCGLPVLSTRSFGGRDVFYNDYNSVICNDNKNSVKNSFDIMMENIDKYDKYKIREGHLEKMDEIRNNVTHYVKNLIEDKFKETVDFNELKDILKHYKP